MSGNSCWSALHTVPIVTAFWRGLRVSSCPADGSGSSTVGSPVSEEVAISG